MTTVSGVQASTAYGYVAPTTGAGNSASPQANAAQPAAPESVLASFGNSASSPLTYNAAGLIHSLQQATPTTSKNTTSAQAAQNAILAAQNAVTDTLNSLQSNSSADSTNSSALDIAALFGVPGTSNSNDPFGLSQSPALNAPASTPATGGSAAQTAQNAVIAAQNAVTQTLNSLGASSSSNSSSSGN